VATILHQSASQARGLPDGDVQAREGEAPKQVLTFYLGEEQYGVDILRVREIRGWSSITRIPKSPPQVLGVLNLRSTVVPVIDLRTCFELTPGECTALTVIIILSVNTADGQRQFGLMVDRVSDVVDITPSSIRAMPKWDKDSRVDFIQTLAVVEDRMLILLDADALMSGDIAAVTLADVPDAT